MDNSDPPNRIPVGSANSYPLGQGAGPLGSGSGDFSTYAGLAPITPFPALGKHEIECYGRAFSNDFDGSPIVTAPVSAPFTGDMPRRQRSSAIHALA